MPVPAARLEDPPAPTHASARKAWPVVLVNFWLDAALFVAVLVLVWTAVILQIAFPEATAAAG